MKPAVSLRLRLTLWSVAVLCAALLVSGVVAEILLSRSLYWSLDQSMALTAGQVESEFNVEDGEEPSIDIQAEDIVRSGSDLIAVIGSTGEPLVLWGALPDDRTKLDALVELSRARGQAVVTLPAGASEELRLRASTLEDYEDSPGVVLIGRSTEEIEAVLSDYRRIAALALLISIGLAGVGGVFLASRALRPVEAIARTAREIEGSDLSRRIDVTGNDELGRLAGVLNQMIARLETAFDRMRQFTGDASHELRTPLSVIRGESTLALRRSRDESGYRRALETISTESEYMSGVLDRLLRIARLDLAGEPVERERVSLRDMLSAVLSNLRALFAERELRVEQTGDDEGVVFGDPVQLRELAIILLDNALKFTPPGGLVTASVGRRDGAVVMSVADTGVGISEEHLLRIFEDFYRVDKARSRSLGGTGLGLGIARRIAEAHGGRIKVESAPGRGTVFHVSLRAADSAGGG